MLMSLGGLVFLAALLGMLLAYLTRTTAIRRMRTLGGEQDVLDAREDKFNIHLGLMTSVQVVGGNEIEVLFNGDQTFPRIWDAIKDAKHVICVHVYEVNPGQVADTLLRALSERAQAGVQVLVLLDAIGSGQMPRSYRQRLIAAGAEVAIYRPLRLKEAYKFQQRMHMRAIVIDGRIGFTGGFGIADQWLGNGRAQDQWRDTNVRIDGPAAMQLQVAFSNNWAEATGDLLIGDTISPFNRMPSVDEPQAAGIMACSPSLGSTNAERFFFLAITSARKRIYIASAYFVPTHGMRWLLMNAVDRGVDVRVLTPGSNTNQPLVWHAGRAIYRQLMDAGVRIYAYQPGMMHAKTFVADACWATVGTFNIDNRSMTLNDEVALIIRDETIAQCLEQHFLADLEDSKELRPRDLQPESGLDWIKIRGSRLLTPFL
ncbi:phospholipase D-like domain-containing protein [Thiorhodococcus fuscus]|uniref:Phosphatidylserine/phosphatidylglycerophosphate/ cardiolipin synthase family protein n=1 Tax=Thiorhodococcus fuscus TaxID=527200 RepID=A0ABW4Y2I3_9GAMM